MNSNIGRGGGGGGGRGGFAGGGFRGGAPAAGFARSASQQRLSPGRIVDRASFERNAAMQNAAARQQQTGSFARRPGPGPGPGPHPGPHPHPGHRPFPRRYFGGGFAYPNYTAFYGYPGYFAESCQASYLAWQNAVAAGAAPEVVASLKGIFESCLYTSQTPSLVPVFT